MFQRKTIATVGFCLGLMLVAVSVGSALDSTNGDAEGCNSDRFKCIMPTAANPTGEAVLDLETRLVWERSPDLATESQGWTGAFSHCATREVGGRLGWSLPVLNQLASLVDKTGTGVDLNGYPLKLPDGNPFVDVWSGGFWTATESANNPTEAWSVRMFDGLLRTNIKTYPNSHVWCVRGGGEATTLDGTFKGRNWCAPIIGTRLGTAEATKTKINDPVTIVWEFDDFPDLDAVITNGPLNFVMDGIAVRKNDKKGFFIMEGREATGGLHFQQLAMQGSYKNDVSQLPAKNVPTKINGNWWMQTLSPLPVSSPTAVACVTQTGSFSGKGNGVTIP